MSKIMRCLLVLFAALSMFGPFQASAVCLPDGTGCGGGGPDGERFSQVGKLISAKFAELCLAPTAPSPEVCQFTSQFQGAVGSTRILLAPDLKGPDGQPRVAAPGPDGTIRLNPDLFNEMLAKRKMHEQLVKELAHAYFVKAGVENDDDDAWSLRLTELLGQHVRNYRDLLGIEKEVWLKRLVHESGIWTSKTQTARGLVTLTHLTAIMLPQGSCTAVISIVDSRGAEGTESEKMRELSVPLDRVDPSQIALKFNPAGCEGVKGKVGCEVISFKTRGATPAITVRTAREARTLEADLAVSSDNDSARALRDALVEAASQCQSHDQRDASLTDGSSSKIVPSGELAQPAPAPRVQREVR